MNRSDRWTLQWPTLCILGVQLLALVAVGAFAMIGEPGTGAGETDADLATTAATTVAAAAQEGQGQGSSR